jgi:hypothetical protein
VKVRVCVGEDNEYGGLKSVTNEIINVLTSLPRGIPRGLFIGVVRGLVPMSECPPLNCSVYTECTITWALQSFYTFIYFTRGLSDDDMCPLPLGLRPACRPGLRLC